MKLLVIGLVLFCVNTLISGMHPSGYREDQEMLEKNLNFIKIDPEKGERKLWVVDGEVAAREKLQKDKKMKKVKLRQVTDGKKLLQMIFVRGKLEKCKPIYDRLVVHKFLQTFKEETDGLHSPQDDALASGKIKRKYLLKLLKMKGFKRRCRKAFLRKHPFLRRRRRIDPDQFRWKRSSKKKAKKNAATHTGEPLKWCGRGYSATNYSDMGTFVGTDRCCRQHDMRCPHQIPAWQRKYGLTNWNLYTLSHCSCDHRFHSCLKWVNTEESHFIGRIFFDIIGVKCFTFETDWECDRKSWFGKCLKWVKKRKAVIKSSWSYAQSEN